MGTVPLGRLGGVSGGEDEVGVKMIEGSLEAAAVASSALVVSDGCCLLIGAVMGWSRTDNSFECC